MFNVRYLKTLYQALFYYMTLFLPFATLGENNQ